MQVYHLLEKVKEVDWLGGWSNHLGNFDQIIGYSILGAILLRASTTQNYLVLYPLRSGNNAKNYGSFASTKDFEGQILQEKGFAKSCLHPIFPEQISILQKRLGALGNEEAYYPVPHPWIGGSWDLNSFDKGNVWINADIAGQNRGFYNT